MKKAKHWYDYLWVYAIIYFALGFFNILFAWLGMIDFLLPLFLAIFGGKVRIKELEKIKTDYKEMVSRALSSL